jgi:hypothetical protein
MTTDPYDSLLSAQTDEHNDTAKLEQHREVEDLKWLMSNKRGRRIVHQILSDAGVFRTSYIPGMDAMQTAFNEGKRNMGLKILATITTHCPTRYAEMIEESAQ